jgi:hypothetical protein
MTKKRTIRKWGNQFYQFTGCLVLVLVISLTVFSRAMADNIITSGCTVKISSGIVVSSIDNLIMDAGSDLNVQGTLVLKKNLVNQNSTPDSLGNGTIEFSGTTNQTISGQNIIQNLTINNSNGLTVSGNTRVSGTLTLTSGRVTLGSNNLSLGPSSAISGTPSASCMIVPAGTGQLQREFPASFTGSYTFPVGDTTGTAEYSPLTLNFISGTFTSGNYAGVTLVNAKYPNDSIMGSYLKRYWALSQSGISSFSCNATLQYLPADVMGTESSIYCTKVNPSPWVTYSAANTGTHQLTANGLTSFSTFTGTRGAADVSLIAYLEGPYNTSTGYMNTTLKTSGLIPLTQPYNTSPFNYAGAEAVASIPTDVVDWVLIELRQASTPANATSATIIKKRAAFMKKDGTIVETDGSSPVRFYNAAITNNLYPVVRQRNHISIMAANAVTMTGGIYTYDFSTGIGQAYGGALGYKQIGSSPARYGMVTGDINQDGSVYTSDFDIWASLAGTANVYNRADLNLDGNVYTSDFDKWATNSGISHPLSAPVRIKFISGVPQ